MVIPYERQLDAQTSRMCGAACLSMVYRSFGKEVSQLEVWGGIAKPNRFGSLASTTHLMARDAFNRGFRALAVQVTHPLQSLRLCRDLGIRAIVNHRLKPEAPTGHYAVFVELDGENVVLHDPFYGPSRRLPHAELLELWQPRFPDSEIVGYVLIGIAAQEPAVAACPFCRTPFPPAVECPKCQQPVGLEPAALLGCMNRACLARMWNYLCCPSCDYTWTFSLDPPPAATGAGPPRGSTPAGRSLPSVTLAPAATLTANDALNLVFEQLDKFCSHLRSVPAEADHPEVKRQLDFITASKEKLKLVQAEEFARRKAAREQLDELMQAAKQNEEESHRRTVEELNAPLPSLDGNALGRALLKNLELGD
ncbi:MAG TPA: cysteine peptidase family C39 domain-containing protein [Chthoniobacterales bacterium]